MVGIGERGAAFAGSFSTNSMIVLRDYQNELIEKTRASIRKGKKSPLLVSPCGSGKTVCFSYFAQRASANGKRVLILAHRTELLDQISDTLRVFHVEHSFVAAGRDFDPDKMVQVASVFSLVRRLSEIKPPDIIIIDECFPSGTLVDGRPIETIKMGDVINCFDEKAGLIKKRKVTRTYKNPSPKIMIRIKTSRGEVVCTQNHPLFTDMGWVEAKNIKKGFYVYEMPMREENGTKREILSKLLSEKDDYEKQTYGLAANERKKSNEASRDKVKNEKHTQENRTSTKNPWWEWAAYIKSSIYFGGAPWFANRIHNKNGLKKKFWLSISLQNRHCGSGSKNSNRGRWGISFLPGKKRTRLKETKDLRALRVESVEVLKSRGFGKFGGMCPQDYVYNLEVDEHHNYFANSILVHNCHHVTPHSTWGKALAAFPSAIRIGVTASPVRLSGEALGDMFDDMVLGPSVTDLIKAGALSRFKIFAPSSIDVSAIETRAGDFVRGKLAAASDKPKVTGDAISEYKKHALGKRAVVFCVSISHANNVSTTFNEAGIISSCIDGKMDKEARKEIIQKFRDGKILVLTSCDLISEGFDLPAIECAIMLRPTKSLGLWTQQSGRALRPFPGKEFAIILDHAGNVQRHGMPDDDREWTLEGKTKKKGPAVKTCSFCFAVNKTWAANCSECNTPFSKESIPRQLEHEDGELQEINKDLLKKQRNLQQAQAQTFEDLVKLGINRGYKYPIKWAHHIMAARSGKKL